MMLLYSFALALALAVLSPVWGWRMLRQRRYREGLPQRLGRVPAGLRAWIAGRPVVWVHAVSVGEVLAATRLVDELARALPDHAVVVSTTTPTGQAVARERFAAEGAERVFFYPLDFAFAVRRHLRALRPSLVVLMESELWPRTLAECERAGVPVAVVNARVSDRSYPRYMRLRRLWRPLLGKVALLLAQHETDAGRWRTIGAPADRVHVSGNLKYDVRVTRETPLAALLRAHLPPDAPVLVCGSTHPGEEAMLLACWTQVGADAVMLVAPRHPQRAAEVLALARENGLPCTTVSDWRATPSEVPPGTVLVLDTVGELAALYALATVAFVGGSLVRRGGQNPLEPAQFGVPVLMGLHYENFRAMVDAMRTAEALAIVSEQSLCSVVEQHLNATENSRMGVRARAFYESESGATERTVNALLRLLNEGRA